VKRFKATTEEGVTQFEVEDGQINLVLDNGNRLDVTFLTLVISKFTDPEEALIDLYTDEDGTENVSIEEVTE
jgi:hypothetical protein